MKRLLTFAVVLAAFICPQPLNATKLIGVKTVDKDYIMVHFRDGEVRYRDDATGPSAYLGHTFVEGDDTLFVFGQRLDPAVAAKAANWTVSSIDDKSFGRQTAVAAWRKSKPMNTDNTLTSELDHWIFLHLPKSMKQGATYTVSIPAGLGADDTEAEVTFDIWSSVSEAVHVNIIGYSPAEETKAADLYLWLGDGGQRDYSAFEGNKVYLYNVETGAKTKVGNVKFWKKASEHPKEAGEKDLTGSDVWTVDFKYSKPGRYRLVVEGVGCSMDFDIKDDVYFEPYHYSLRGYYYMRLGEPIDPAITPVPRQPQFIPEVDPIGLTIYKTDMHPWHPDWRKLRGDVWDEPHFKPALQSEFWKHRLPGNPVNTEVRGGHSDAMDWDRHLAHVSNIYDLLLPYILTGGRLSEDNLSIRESGNGIPDLLDEARNEVDFFLSIRDGEAYSQGVTNPSTEWTIMFQAGCTTMAAWANAANCAMMAEAFRIHGDEGLCAYYTAEAVKAYRYAEKQAWTQLDDWQNIGTSSMRGRDFKQMAAAFLYNLTGERCWEDAMALESVVKDGKSMIFNKQGRNQFYQIWGTAAYLTCPHERHYPELYANMKSSVNHQADENNVSHMHVRPSRRTANDPRWQTSQNLQMVILAHYIAENSARKAELETAMYIEAGWGLGRNPANTVEMTGLGERHIIDCYTTGRNDGTPGSHPGQTPFNGTETWSAGNGGDARIILGRCYPDWYTAGWPRQESFFNIRYMWVNGEFTPRETMRGKMALLAYLYGIRKDGHYHFAVACGNPSNETAEAVIVDSVTEALADGGKINVTELKWTREPLAYEMNDSVITITTAPHTDLWQRTYYHFRNDNAPVLQMQTREKYFSFVVKTDFTQSHHRFDQCGVVMYLDSENWLKASVEFENEEFQHLGSVVTNNGYSDWATTAIPADVKTMWYRFSRRADDFCIECSTDGERFSQMRICHMHAAADEISFGIYACSPEESSFTAVFSDMKITECMWKAHDGQQPDEL